MVSFTRIVEKEDEMDERERLNKVEQAAGRLLSDLRDILKHTESLPKMESNNSDLILQSVMLLGQRLAALEEKVGEIHQVVLAQRVQKEWYTTGELAEALGKSRFTVQDRWCNEGRIECEKARTPASGESLDKNIGGWSGWRTEAKAAVSAYRFRPRTGYIPRWT